jgi:DNA polymerase-3 subunit beta
VRISISRPALQQAVTQAARAASGRAAIPVLAGLLLRAEGNGLTITGYDMDMAIEVRTPASVEEPGELVVPAKQFVGIVKSLPHSEIVMTLVENSLKIQSDRTDFSLQTMNAAEFPALPEVGGQFAIIPHEAFGECARKVAYAASVADNRAVYRAVNTMVADGELTMVATDTFRLAVRRAPAPDCEPLSVLLPVGFVSEIERLGGAVHLHLSDNHVQVQSGDTRIIARLIEGEWPNWQAVLPTTCATWVTAERDALIGALQRASLMCKDDLTAVTLKLDGGDLIITAAQAEVGEAREELTVQYGGEGVLDVAVRPKYLRDALAVMGGDEVRIEYTSFKHPVKVLDESDPDWTYVVMPVMRPS